MSITVTRKPLRLDPDSSRVIAKFFMPGKIDRVVSIVEKVIRLPKEQAKQQLEGVLRQFTARHRNISKVFESHYEQVLDLIAGVAEPPHHIPTEKKLLIGAYFTMEYSIEASAFFNPSIVVDPHQGALPPGSLRVILSFRATGEGHLSSIVFRGGVLDENNNLELDPPSSLVDLPEHIRRHTYSKKEFLEKLDEMRVHKDVVSEIVGSLGESFSYGELRANVTRIRANEHLSYSRQKVIDAVEWVADSHYEVNFSRDTGLSERVIFPVSESESNGIEDARFVRFVEENKATYFATYTAYNGYAILPKLLETTDFCRFSVRPLHGQRAQNKGMSLFPRKINDCYAMIGRCDGISLYLLYSKDIHFWSDAKRIQTPTYPWEYVQIGNSGSPIETDDGWLLITHGVGPVRTYSLGATLLDLEDPTQVIGQSKEPILIANAEERVGYVPNVVYSCGSIVHNDELVLPYAMSDSASSYATIPLAELIAILKNNG